MPRTLCDNYHICDSYDCIFGICEASDMDDIHLAASDIQQCSHTEKVKISILASIDEKLAKLLEK